MSLIFETGRPSWAAIAQAVAGIGHTAPPTLAQNLERVAIRIAQFQNSNLVPNSMRSNREAFRNSLRRIERSALLLHEKLEDPILRLHIRNATDGEPLDTTGLRAQLLNLAARATAVCAAIPVKQGREDMLPLHCGRGAPSVTAQEIAALAILEAWERCHHRHPGPDNPEAQKAVELYWCAITGKSATGWHHLFVAVKKLRDLRNDERAGLIAEIQAAIWQPELPPTMRR